METRSKRISIVLSPSDLGDAFKGIYLDLHMVFHFSLFDKDGKTECHTDSSGYRWSLRDCRITEKQKSILPTILGKLCKDYQNKVKRNILNAIEAGEPV